MIYHRFNRFMYFLVCHGHAHAPENDWQAVMELALPAYGSSSLL